MFTLSSDTRWKFFIDNVDNLEANVNELKQLQRETDRDMVALVGQYWRRCLGIPEVCMKLLQMI